MRPRDWLQPSVKTIVTLLLGVVILQGLFAWLALSPRISLQRVSQFGDAFGFMAALFTGLAFAGLILTILHQRSELERQSFESTFFQLLRFQRDTALGLSARFAGPRSESYKGLDAFREAENELADRLAVVFNPEPSHEARVRFLTTSYEQVCRQKDADFSHYFRNLFHVFLFVDESSVRDRTRYTMLARAQLSNHELSLLFINCLTRYGREFKPLVERYTLLRGARLPEPFGQYRDWYESSAFERGDRIARPDAA